MEESSSPPETPLPPPPPLSPPLLSSFQESDDTASQSSLESYIDDLDMSIDYPPFDDNSDSESDELNASELQSDVTNNTPSVSDTSPSQTESQTENVSCNSGYKLVFDNIDMNVRPRFMRIGCQTQSLHYVQGYAVKDRISFSHISDKIPTEMNVYNVVPDDSDYQSLKSDFEFAVLVLRIIVEYMPFFNTDYKGIPQPHIPHKYTKQMSSKSEVVRVLLQ